MTVDNRDPVASCRLPEKDHRELERLAKRLKITKSSLIRACLQSGLEDIQMSEKLGIVSLVAFIRKHKVDPKEVYDFVYDRRVSSS